MAGSIDDWYADRADGSDGPGDGEFVERQAAWDTDRPARSSSMAKRPTTTSPSTQRTGAASLTAEQRRLRSVVSAMRRRHPGVSYKRLAELLRTEGTRVSRGQISAILATHNPVAPRSTSVSSRGARSGQTERAVPLTAARAESERFAKLAAEAQKAAKRMAAEAKKAGFGEIPPASQAKAAKKQRVTRQRQTPSPRPLRDTQALHRSTRSASVNQHPGRAARSPARLVLDEPIRKPVKTTGWTRARNVHPVAAVQHLAVDVPIPCYACGVVPTQFGLCRCT